MALGTPPKIPEFERYMPPASHKPRGGRIRLGALLSSRGVSAPSDPDSERVPYRSLCMYLEIGHENLIILKGGVGFSGTHPHRPTMQGGTPLAVL